MAPADARVVVLDGDTGSVDVPVAGAVSVGSRRAGGAPVQVVRAVDGDRLRALVLRTLRSAGDTR